MLSKLATCCLAVLFANRAMASCAYGTILQPRAEGKVEVGKFSYVGPTGPANWVSLDPVANALCSTGKSQSPIDMVSGSFSVIPAAQLSLSIADMAEGADFENLGTTVEVIAEQGAGTMSFGGVKYTLQQFHFHLPSEHLDNGTSMAMEMHMVWQGEGKEIAVIGTFIDVDDGTTPASETPAAETPTPSAETVARRSVTRQKEARRQVSKGQSQQRRQLPGIGGSFFHVTAPSTGATTASALLETVLGSVEEIAEPGTVTKTQPLVMSEVVQVLESGSFQTYEGSLTTPPCSEGVRWLVSDQKLSIPVSTFLKARSVIGFNSRFPQSPLGEENVLNLAQKA